MLDTSSRLFPGDFPPILRGSVDTLQVNLGYLCNQSCQHCHVDAGPMRTEIMTSETIGQVLHALRVGRFSTLDLTGGAPELNPDFRSLVETATADGVQVIDRCNLTVLLEPGQETLADFLADQRVRIVASLPCYLQENVDGQRGKGAYGKSIRALHLLNDLGYGLVDSGLVLDLVYNPQGPSLPPSQASLEADYRRELADDPGVRFNSLLTITNMPIKRFGSMLASTGQFDEYLALLKQAHRPENVPAVMCRNLLSVDWQGYLYDCDFNQMLGLPLGGGGRIHISELDLDGLAGQRIAVADHCYGCTAGAGSSCGGALG